MSSTKRTFLSLSGSSRSFKKRMAFVPVCECSCVYELIARKSSSKRQIDGSHQIGYEEQRTPQDGDQQQVRVTVVSSDLSSQLAHPASDRSGHPRRPRRSAHPRVGQSGRGRAGL